MSNFLKKPIVLKIVALLLAVFIWVYVINIENPETDIEIRSVPVTINTTDSIPYQNGLVITDGLTQTVDVKIRGRHSAVSEFDKSSIIATVDIDSITEEGTYSLPVSVYIPGNSVWLINQSPTRITYTFSRVETKTVDVRTVTAGSMSEEYIIDSQSVSPETVTLRGPASELELVKYAAAEVYIESISENMSTTVPLVLYGEGDSWLNLSNVTIDPGEAKVELKVLKKKTVKLTFDMDDHSSGEYSHLWFDVSPDTIDICGEEQTIDAINEINLGKVDPSGFEAGDERSVDIKLPQGVKAVSGVKTATIKAHSSQDDIYQMEDVPIDTSGMAALELQGFEISLSSSSVDVVLSGDKQELSSIKKSDVIATADFSQIEAKAGVYSIPVIVTVGGDGGVSVVGTYSISAEVVPK